MNEPIAVPASPAPVIPLLGYQRQDIESDARFRWCCWSRQVGKSFTKSLRRLLRGLDRRRTQVFLSAGERQSRELMLKAQQHCRALNIAARFLGDRFFEGSRFRQLTLELPNGVRVIGLPANPQTVRGFTGDVLLDEFAMHADDREIWAAVFPTALRGEGEIDIASTPRGWNNVFAELRDNPQFEHSTVRLTDAIAAGLPLDADRVRASIQDDELYRQEFCCEFLDDSSAFLSEELVLRAEDPGLDTAFEQGRLAGCRGDLYCGVDIGRVRDLTVMWVVERCGNDLVTRGIRHTANEPFRAQQEALHTLLGLHRLRHCCIDAGGIGMSMAEAAVDAFGQARVEAVTLTGAVKDRLATGLRLRLEEGSLRIPVDAQVRSDWQSVRRCVTAPGLPRYEARRSGSGHADRFWAAALAIRAADADGPARTGEIGIIEPGPVRYARQGVW